LLLQWSHRVTPLDGFGMLVPLSEVRQQGCFQVVEIRKVVRRQDLPLERGEHDFDLIQPGGMDRQPMDMDGERQPEGLDPRLQPLGRVGGPVVHDQVQDADAVAPETLEHHAEKRLEVDEALARPAPGNRLARVDQQPRKQLQRPFPLVSISRAQRMPRTGGRNASRELSGLDRRLLIGTHDDLASSGELLRLGVEVQDDRGLFQEARIGRLLPRVVLPRLDLVFAQPAGNGRGRNGGNDPLGDGGLGNLSAGPAR